MLFENDTSKLHKNRELYVLFENILTYALVTQNVIIIGLDIMILATSITKE